MNKSIADVYKINVGTVRSQVVHSVTSKLKIIPAKNINCAPLVFVTSFGRAFNFLCMEWLIACEIVISVLRIFLLLLHILQKTCQGFFSLL